VEEKILGVFSSSTLLEFRVGRAIDFPSKVKGQEPRFSKPFLMPVDFPQITEIPTT
jgi:hypothetical protein